ncbi:MAG: hypothetical protein OEX12_08235 [Gammaproteobacteria bacterium]|nr:hypothetical protein [Gammaproteobacteria bacterium]
MSKILSAQEKDLLIELFNIGIGKAAASLGIISKQEISVSIPEINLILFTDFIDSLPQQELCCVIQRSFGSLNSISALIFSQEGSFEIVRRMLGKHIDVSSNTELYQDAIREIGNIMLNACIGSIAKALDIRIETELPNLQTGPPNNMLEDNLLQKDDMILDVIIDMHMVESDIAGTIVFIMGPFSLNKLKQGLKPIIKRIS